MELYLPGMGRWLCGSCFRTNRDVVTSCDFCEAPQDDVAVSGARPAGAEALLAALHAADAADAPAGPGAAGAGSAAAAAPAADDELDAPSPA